MKFTAWIPEFLHTREDSVIPFEAAGPRDAARIHLETFAEADAVWPESIVIMVERTDVAERFRYAVSVPVSVRVAFNHDESTVSPQPLVNLVNLVGLAGIDGIRPVFWGIGETIEAARLDAAEHLADLSNLTPDDLTSIPITFDRMRQIAAGDVALRGAELAIYAAASRNL